MDLVGYEVSGMTIAWIGTAIPKIMTRNETAEKREPRRTMRYPAAREDQDRHWPQQSSYRR
jgi:hypothetical protein